MVLPDVQDDRAFAAEPPVTVVAGVGLALEKGLVEGYRRATRGERLRARGREDVLQVVMGVVLGDVLEVVLEVVLEHRLWECPR